MFKKLLSNLPFNPSLVKQISFYSARMKSEASVRRLSSIFIVLAMFIQFVSVVSPAQPSLASSANDIIPGGIGSVQQAVDWCNGNAEIRGIFAYYDVSCADVAASKQVTRHTRDYNGQMMSLGRWPYGKPGETTLKINGKNYYARYVWGWGNYRFSALEGTAKGKRFLIMMDCGNIISLGVPQPRAKPKLPDIATTKTVSNAAPLKGQTFSYTVTVKNNGPGTATGVGVSDKSPQGLQFQAVTGGLGSPRISNNTFTTSRKFNLGVGNSTTYRITAKLLIDGPIRRDNTACALASNGEANGNNNCGTAIILVRQVCPLPGKTNLSLDHPNCNTPGLKIEKTADRKEHNVGETFTYTLKVTNTGDVNLPRVIVRDVAPSHLEFTEVKEPGAASFTSTTNKLEYIGRQFSLAKGASTTVQLKAKIVSGTKNPVVNEACTLGYTQTDAPAGACDDETITIKACGLPGKEHLPPDSPDCRPCSESENQDDANVCIELSKTAANETQNLSNADGTLAKAGDVITYTLSARNTGSVPVNSFAIEESIGDILDYADVVDFHGGTLNRDTKIVKWPSGTIAASTVMQQKLTVKIKNPIPQTTVSGSNPGTFDLIMNNVYGNSVNIRLPGSVIKTTEQITTTLPNTGPGTSLVIGFVIVTVLVYFFARSRLLATELDIVRAEYTSTGGA